MPNEIFNDRYYSRRNQYTHQLAGEITAKYSPQDFSRIVVPNQSIENYLAVTGNNFPSKESINVLLGNTRELVTPGHHYTRQYEVGRDNQTQESVNELVKKTFDAVYAISYISIAEKARSESSSLSQSDIEENAFAAAANFIAKIPDFIEWHRWNVFAHLKDPAIWSNAVREGISLEDIARLENTDFPKSVMDSLTQGNTQPYQDLLNTIGAGNKYPLLLNLVDSRYDGPKSLLNHYIAHQLAVPDTKSGDLKPNALYLIPELIQEINSALGLDAHPEAKIGYGELIDHERGTVVIGQTGIVGNYWDFAGGGIVLGGLSRKPSQRHPILGNGISIGTSTMFFGPIVIGDYSRFGVNSIIIGYIRFGNECRVGSDVDIGSYNSLNGNNSRPGQIIFENGVIVGDGSTILNTGEEDLVIGEEFKIKPKSYVVGVNGKPQLVERPHNSEIRADAKRLAGDRI